MHFISLATSIVFPFTDTDFKSKKKQTWIENSSCFPYTPFTPVLLNKTNQLLTRMSSLKCFRVSFHHFNNSLHQSLPSLYLSFFCPLFILPCMFSSSMLPLFIYTVRLWNNKYIIYQFLVTLVNAVNMNLHWTNILPWKFVSSSPYFSHTRKTPFVILLVTVCHSDFSRGFYLERHFRKRKPRLPMMQWKVCFLLKDFMHCGTSDIQTTPDSWKVDIRKPFIPISPLHQNAHKRILLPLSRLWSHPTISLFLSYSLTLSWYCMLKWRPGDEEANSFDLNVVSVLVEKEQPPMLQNQARSPKIFHTLTLCLICVHHVFEHLLTLNLTDYVVQVLQPTILQWHNYRKLNERK